MEKRMIKWLIVENIINAADSGSSYFCGIWKTRMNIKELTTALHLELVTYEVDDGSQVMEFIWGNTNEEY